MHPLALLLTPLPPLQARACVAMHAHDCNALTEWNSACDREGAGSFSTNEDGACVGARRVRRFSTNEDGACVGARRVRRRVRR